MQRRHSGNRWRIRGERPWPPSFRSAVGPSGSSVPTLRREPVYLSAVSGRSALHDDSLGSHASLWQTSPVVLLPCDACFLANQKEWPFRKAKQAVGERPRRQRRRGARASPPLNDE